MERPHIIIKQPGYQKPGHPSGHGNAQLDIGQATPEQEAVLRRAAETCHKPLTEFIMDSACQAAEQTLLNRRVFMVSGERDEEFLGLLDRTAEDNAGLRELYAKPAPWDDPCT